MKTIKKVEVTAIDNNIGKIIDSDATTDDKTKNTYSMRVIDEAFDDATATYKASGDFAVISGDVDDIPGGQVSGVTVNLPSGFTRSNSFVIGRVYGEKGYVLNDIYGNTIASGSSRMDDYINIHFSSSSELMIEIYNIRSSTVSCSYKILLMKI